MHLSFKQLKHRPVQTNSGEQLGKLKDVVFETEGQLITQYAVAPHLWPGKELLISRDQIILIDDKKIVVDDSVGAIFANKSTNGAPIRLSPDAIAMRGE